MEESQNMAGEACTICPGSEDPADPQEAQASQGKQEYDGGNFEAGLQAFEGIDLRPILMQLQNFATSKVHHRRRARALSAELLSRTLRTADILFEGVFLKAKSLQSLGRLSEAAQECKGVMSLMESAFPQGLPATWITDSSKLTQTVGQSVQLLPNILVDAGLIQEAIAAYRRALLGHFHLDAKCCADIQKKFAVLILYGGVEAAAPSLWSQAEGSFIPKNNIEEAVLLLLLLLRGASLKITPHDPTVIEHLTFALSVSGQSEFLAHQYELMLPGIQSRSERWCNLALCYIGATQDDVALNLLRKSLNHVENPNDVDSLLLAAKLCARRIKLAAEGIGYAERAMEQAKGHFEHMKCMALHVLGVVIGCAVKAALSDSERSHLHARALSNLQDAATLQKNNAKVIFDLGLEYAEQRNLGPALDCAKRFMGMSGGASVHGWKLLVLVLSAQQRYEEAEEAVDAALDDTGQWDQGKLLRIKAKIQMAQGLSIQAIKTYKLLLALSQAQSRCLEAGTEMDKAAEFVTQVEVWQDLAALYTSLKQLHDAETCLEKAQALQAYSSVTWHVAGVLHEAQDNVQDALAAYNIALAIDPDHVPSKLSTGALLRQRGGNSLPVARSFLIDALRSEPTNHHVWDNLGLLHKVEGRTNEAADCFQAAFLLEQSAPVDKFSSIPRALFW